MYGQITENEARGQGIKADYIVGNERYNDRYRKRWTPRADLAPNVQPSGWRYGVPPSDDNED